MDSASMTLLITIIICIILSAYFSSTETAFSSLNKARLKSYVKHGNQRAKLAYELSDQFDKILSTILIGNNIVNIVSASLATVLFTRLMSHDEAAAVIASTVVMTIVVLIFGEITPKILAKENPEKIAMLFAPLLRMFMIILLPLNFPFSLWKKLLNKIFKFKKDKGLSDDELINIIEETEQLGGIDEHESKLIRSAIKFDDLEASDVLTSRQEIIAISNKLSMEEVKNVFLENEYSRMPVYDENIDQIVGFILEKDFYKILLQDKIDFKEIIKPLYFTLPKMKVSNLLRELQSTKIHMSIVVDEFGGTMGLVTVEDILEELVGEIWDEHDKIVNEFTEIDDNKYIVLGSSNLKNFFDEFAICLESEKYDNIKTVSGWVIKTLNYIPHAGETFKYENMNIKIKKTKYSRILEIEVHVES
ncbi:MAG: hemolysin family protein [Bacillota bacterium]